jgi:hypothetical protein
LQDPTKIKFYQASDFDFSEKTQGLQPRSTFEVAAFLEKHKPTDIFLQDILEVLLTPTLPLPKKNEKKRKD